jgi:hypothetical protein
MATFCEKLAETAVVAEACDAAGMGISGAYAARRRNPVFAAAWDAALSIARERLADTLLARSMEGNIEQVYKDGELIGERHVIDNRLGLAILRRLDRLAETGMTVSLRGERTVLSSAHRGTAPIDWECMVAALRSGDEGEIAYALASLRPEVEEVEDPPVSFNQGDDEDGMASGYDPPERCWTDDRTGEKVWMTSFPPPPVFDGYEKGEWGEYGYERECSLEEAKLLKAEAAAIKAVRRAEKEAERDAWFDMLSAELKEATETQGTA